VGIALIALGEAVSDFLSPEVQSSLSLEALRAVIKINKGAKILADLFYRLSMTRKTQITPALNLTAKNTADTIPANSFLFGTSFGDEMKKATTMEKSAKDIVKSPLVIAKKVQQPIKQPAQIASTRSGNARAPVRNSRPVITRRTGASNSNRRSSYRSTSQSRRR